MQLNQALAQWVKAGIVPGLSSAWYHQGRWALQVLGHATTAPTVTPLHSGQLYDLASLTKVVGTTTLFLQAWQAGLVSPHARLSQWLPTDYPITFEQALTHTSGLEGYIPNRDALPAAALKTALLTQLHPSGNHQVVYRDFNLLMVGWALEAVYGAPIQPLIEKRVLAPLGLVRATFNPAPASSVPTTYDATTHQLLAGRVHDPKSAILGEHSGAAGLFASLADLQRFCEVAMRVGKQPAAWPAAAFSQLNRDLTGGGQRTLGWALLQDRCGRDWLYHTGYTGTFMLIQPATQQALVVLTNRVHPTVNPAFLGARDQLITNLLESALV